MMADKPRWIENASYYEIDLGFAVMTNGDIVTSDGLLRGSWDEQGWIEQFGKPPTFRKPTEAEASQHAEPDRCIGAQLR